MNIAICDDNPIILGQLETIIETSINRQHEILNCDVFLSGNDLLNKISTDNKVYQIYLLDIEMPGINGLQVAEIIRENDDKAIVIFLTSHKQLMQKAFDVLAFYFLLKLLDENELKHIIRKAIDKINSSRNLFYFQVSKSKYCIPYESILYFESDKRLVKVHTEKELYSYYDTMQNLMKKLNLSVFVQTHASFIVNLNYVKILQGDVVVLTNNCMIPVSKKYIKDFNKCYRDFILKRMW